MKLKLSIISISLVTMATARHNEVIMRPLDAPDHICGSGGCNTMSHLEAPHPYSMCGEDLLGITSMDLSEDPISPGTTAKVTLKGLPIIDIGSGSITVGGTTLDPASVTTGTVNAGAVTAAGAMTTATISIGGANLPTNHRHTTSDGNTGTPIA